MSSRYDPGDAADCEPGSDGTVLCNKLALTDPADINEVELSLLQKLYEAVLIESFPDRRLHVADLKTWHRRWLGNVYAWAGEERSVNISKGDFQFAAAAQIPRLLDIFERDCLAKFTPCHDVDDAAVIEAIAQTHVEFILIHPFREGNGRLSRLLADVMAVQAGHEPLDYSAWDANKAGYIRAIHAGLAGDYAPMRDLVLAAWARGDESSEL